MFDTRLIVEQGVNVIGAREVTGKHIKTILT